MEPPASTTTIEEIEESAGALESCDEIGPGDGASNLSTGGKLKRARTVMQESTGRDVTDLLSEITVSAKGTPENGDRVVKRSGGPGKPGSCGHRDAGDALLEKLADNYYLGSLYAREGRNAPTVVETKGTYGPPGNFPIHAEDTDGMIGEIKKVFTETNEHVQVITHRGGADADRAAFLQELACEISVLHFWTGLARSSARLTGVAREMVQRIYGELRSTVQTVEFLRSCAYDLRGYLGVVGEVTEYAKIRYKKGDDSDKGEDHLSILVSLATRYARRAQLRELQLNELQN